MTITIESAEHLFDVLDNRTVEEFVEQNEIFDTFTNSFHQQTGFSFTDSEIEGEFVQIMRIVFSDSKHLVVFHETSNSVIEFLVSDTNEVYFNLSKSEIVDVEDGKKLVRFELNNISGVKEILI